MIFRLRRWRRLACADLLHVGDGQLFLKHGARLGSHLLRRHGALISRVEERLLPGRPAWAVRDGMAHPRAYWKTPLGDGELTNLYTELMALDIQV